MEKIICGNLIQVNEEGYLTNLAQWSRDIAEAIAKEEGIEVLTPRHWEVIEYLQDQFKKEVPTGPTIISMVLNKDRYLTATLSFRTSQPLTVLILKLTKEELKVILAV